MKDIELQIVFKKKCLSKVRSKLHFLNRSVVDLEFIKLATDH